MRRLEQVSAFLQERVGAFLLTHAETTPGVLVTVTGVTVTPDLRAATVAVSVWPASRRQSVLRHLRRLVPELRRALYQDLATRAVPAIRFVFDETEARAAEVERLIDALDQP
jgi:ribosome-binding factor A